MLYLREVYADGAPSIVHSRYGLQVCLRAWAAYDPTGVVEPSSTLVGPLRRVGYPTTPGPRRLGCIGALPRGAPFLPQVQRLPPRAVIGKAEQEAAALQPGPYVLFEPCIQDMMEIGSKDGALPHYWGTSPPSALRTGQATPRGIRLASEGLSMLTHRCACGPWGRP
jgi:hypothetical protein